MQLYGLEWRALKSDGMVFVGSLAFDSAIRHRTATRTRVCDHDDEAARHDLGKETARDDESSMEPLG